MIQASKVVETYGPLMDLHKEGLMEVNPTLPPPAQRSRRSLVVPFWTRPEDFHVFVSSHCS